MHGKDENIDNIFRQKLDGYEIAPPPEVWERVTESLDAKKRKTGYIWIQRIAVAAGLAIAFATGWFLSGNQSKQYMVNNLDNQERFPGIDKIIPVAHNVQLNLELPSFKPLVEKIYIKPDINEIFNQQAMHEPLLAMKSENTSMLPVVDMNQSLILDNDDLFSEEDKFIMTQNIDRLKSKEIQKEQSWSIGVQVAPAYRFDGFGNADYETPNVYNMDASGGSNYDVNATGGIVLAYNAGKRLTFETGIGYNAIAQTGGGIPVSFAGHNWVDDRVEAQYSAISNEVGDRLPTLTDQNNNDAVINTNLGVAVLKMENGTNLSYTKSAINGLQARATIYDLSQQAGYVEIPLAMKYKLVEGKLGLHVLGGINANVLVSNNVSLQNGENVIASGIIEGLKPLTFSSRMGIGVDYKLSKRFNLSFEPTISVLISSLNEQSNISTTPYTFGVFSGLEYSF